MKSNYLISLQKNLHLKKLSRHHQNHRTWKMMRLSCHLLKWYITLPFTHYQHEKFNYYQQCLKAEGVHSLRKPWLEKPTQDLVEIPLNGIRDHSVPDLSTCPTLFLEAHLSFPPPTSNYNFLNGGLILNSSAFIKGSPLFGMLFGFTG